MRDLLILAVYRLVTLAKLLRPGAARAVAAESLLLRQQLLVIGALQRYGTDAQCREALQRMTGNYRPILLKNSPRKFGRKYFNHEKAIAEEFRTETLFNTTLVVKRFLKTGTFFSTERADRVFQQNRSTATTDRNDATDSNDYIVDPFPPKRSRVIPATESG
jgi:hypothetical protein